MQWPELVVIAVIVGAAWPQLDERSKPYARPAAWAALALILIDLLYRGPALQLAPLALAALLLAGSALLQLRNVFSRVAGLGALALASTSVGLLIVLPFFLLPRPTGPYAVGTRILFLADPSRGLDGGSPNGPQDRRPLVVQAWYPTHPHSGRLARYVRRGEVKPLFWYFAGLRTNSLLNASVTTDGAPFPVLLYGHSWGSRRTIDTFLAEDLASHGYIVLAIDHPLNTARMELEDGAVLRSDRAGALENPNTTTPQAIEAVWAHELTLWVADQQFVLAQLQSARGEFMWLEQAADLTRVGAFGHSFGGAAALAMLGTEPRRLPEVRAAVDLDGWTFKALDHRTLQPILMLYAGDWSESPSPTDQSTAVQLDRSDRSAVQSSLTHFGGTLACVRTTQHLDFTDQTLVSPFQRLTYTGPMAGERVRTLTRQLVLSFFNRTLRGDPMPLPADPEARMRIYPVPAHQP